MLFRMATVATLLASLGMVGMAQAGTVKNGTFEATGQGRNGPIDVSVTFKSGKIQAVKVLKQSETVGIADTALKEFPQRLVKGNSTAVDSVAGATLTSNGIRQGVNETIRKAGGSPIDFAVIPISEFKKGEAHNLSTDILVVGAGGSGLSAAVRAASQGTKVILIEKMPMIGGVTQLNAGTLIATGSRYQREVMKETKDSPELAAKDIMRIGKDRNDPVLVKTITQRVGGVVDWLIDDLKIPYGPAATQYPDHSANRQLGVQGRSVNFLKLMNQKFADYGGKLMLSTRADRFITDESGKVIGVKAFDEHGNSYEIKSKATILASGGYGAEKHRLPRPQGVETTPGHGLAATASSTDTIKKSGAIYVNQDGKRFVNEREGLGVLTDATIAQPNHIAYIVMDDAAWKLYVAKSLEDKLVPNAEALDQWAKISNQGVPVMAVSNNLADAAKVMGINPENLAKTVEDWNAMAKNGKDDAFNRPITGALGAGPYHIVEQKVRYQTTLGGLKANGNLAILNQKDAVIPALYGAGCVVGGANGADSMTAMMNSWAIVSGVVAADSAVKYVRSQK